MNAHQLFVHYENAPRIIHWERAAPEFACKNLCFEGPGLFQRDMEEIARLQKIYPQPVAEKTDLGKPRTKGFRERLKSRLPEIRQLLDDGDPAWEVAQKLNLSETTIRRVIRHLRGEKSDEKNAVAIIGTHKITGEVVEFQSMNQAENYGGFGGSKIRLCLIGLASQHKGYTWRKK